MAPSPLLAFRSRRIALDQDGAVNGCFYVKNAPFQPVRSRLDGWTASRMQSGVCEEVVSK